MFDISDIFFRSLFVIPQDDFQDKTKSRWGGVFFLTLSTVFFFITKKWMI